MPYPADKQSLFAKDLFCPPRARFGGP